MYLLICFVMTSKKSVAEMLLRFRTLKKLPPIKSIKHAMKAQMNSNSKLLCHTN